MANLATRVSGSIRRNSFRTEEQAAMYTALWGRVVALAFIAILTTFLTSWPGPIYIYSLLVLFLVNGLVAYTAAVQSWGRPWHQFVFVTIDAALLTFTLIYPNPLLPIDIPPQFNLRNGVFIYFFVIIAGLAYVYRPNLVVWGGVAGAGCWLLGVLWVLGREGSFWGNIPTDDMEEFYRIYGLPDYVDLGVRLQEAVVYLIVAGLLALAVRRARVIALRQANLAEERSNLARYFPSQTADLLARQTDPFTTAREHQAAVLFADLVAFTAWSEMHEPSQTIDLLREVHGMLAEIVFRNDGTLDKFIGDGVMATFGTPEPGERDGPNAIAAALQMIDAFDAWKKTQRDPGRATLALSVGVHYGPIVMGDIGSDKRLEFAVLGDTVNVASRLENATRELGCRCLISRDLLQAAEADPEFENLRNRLRNQASVTLRGRAGRIGVVVVE